MVATISFLGFGEAARTFVSDVRWRGLAKGYDRKTDIAGDRDAMLQTFAALGVTACETCAAAVAVPMVLSVVTADQALRAAEAAALHMTPGSLFLDMNSVAPATKQAAARAVEARGAFYVDVAIMAPVKPAALGAPLLLSGPRAEPARLALRDIGFASMRVVGEEVGRASLIKMVRSVLIKGVEAATAECLRAAAAGGVVEEVLFSLSAEQQAQANYNLERMLAHGTRRAAEMEESARTLRDLGIEPRLTEATIQLQREAGAVGLATIPLTLQAKLAALTSASAL